MVAVVVARLLAATAAMAVAQIGRVLACWLISYSAGRLVRRLLVGEGAELRRAVMAVSDGNALAAITWFLAVVVWAVLEAQICERLFGSAVVVAVVP